MKIAIGYHVQAQAWGGGNRFVAALAAALEDRGDSVVTGLGDEDIDIILMIDPRARNPTTAFTPGAILRHILRRNPRAIVVHRINECDERKNTKTMNARLRLANQCADHTVFVASWLMDLPVWRNKDRDACSVILNGSDPAIFNRAGHHEWNAKEPMRLVTHHWGGNWLKGFDIYQQLDRMLAAPEWQDRIEFTYIGNLPPGFAFKHARHVSPLDTTALADALRGHHVYVTASINEPGSHHQNEGALCGLPLLYRNSGCLPEYCDGYGIMFESDGFAAALEGMIAAYPRWSGVMPQYEHVANRTNAAYIALFDTLLADRDGLVARRRVTPLSFLLNQIPW